MTPKQDWKLPIFLLSFSWLEIWAVSSPHAFLPIAIRSIPRGTKPPICLTLDRAFQKQELNNSFSLCTDCFRNFTMYNHAYSPQGGTWHPITSILDSYSTILALLMQPLLADHMYPHQAPWSTEYSTLRPCASFPPQANLSLDFTPCFPTPSCLNH